MRHSRVTLITFDYFATPPVMLSMRYQLIARRFRRRTPARYSAMALRCRYDADIDYGCY